MARKKPLKRKRPNAAEFPSWYKPDLSHERYDPLRPRLRELVSVHVSVSDGSNLVVLLTRVPGIGEEVESEGRCYKVTRVQHQPVDDNGRAYFGWHAWIEAELLPSET